MPTTIGKATRIAFLVGEECAFQEEAFNFDWHMGMSWQVRQRSSTELHQQIAIKYPNKQILEVSTKSTNYELGRNLSAFLLTLDGIPIENHFQAAKVFQSGGPYTDLLSAPSKDAKRDPRLKNNDLIKFTWQNQDFDLEPKSAFYDYIYILALAQHPELAAQVINYDIFTDIEFNQKVPYTTYKGPFNCQARAIAIYVWLSRHNLLAAFLKDHKNLTSQIYPTVANKQETLFP